MGESLKFKEEVQLHLLVNVYRMEEVFGCESDYALFPDTDSLPAKFQVEVIQDSLPLVSAQLNSLLHCCISCTW